MSFPVSGSPIMGRLRGRRTALIVGGALTVGLLPATVPTVAQDAPLAVLAGIGDGTVAGQAFLPGAFTVNVGDSVTFAIGSDQAHTITLGEGPSDVAPPFWPVAGFTAPAPDAPPPFDLGTASFDGTNFLNTGIVGGKTTSATVTFDVPGTYPFFCVIHPGMAGEVEVLEGGTATTQAEADAAAALTAEALLTPVDEIRAARLAATTTTANADGTTTWNVFADAGTEAGPMPGGGTGFLELLEFTPPVLEVGAGDTVTWSMLEVHSVTFVPEGVDPASIFTSEEVVFAPLGGDTYDGSAAVSSGVLGLGPDAPDTFSLTFPAPGDFPFFCLLHADLGQVGQVTVST